MSRNAVERPPTEQNERNLVALEAVLELLDARPRFEDGGLAAVRYNLRLNPGDLVLVECPDPQQAALFADLCVGLLPLTAGQVRCMGMAWQDLDDRRRAALRGRVGRTVVNGGWVDLYGTDLNILWPHMHHTRVPTEKLAQRAIELGVRFGLPGLPVSIPSKLSLLDRYRADCVRAFLGDPALLLLENPLDDVPMPLLQAFLASLTEARDRGAAGLWITRGTFPAAAGRIDATSRWRLHDDGLFLKRGA
ncbi:ABC transporter ATP-binding protein [Neokomagataea thailandica NBRC 106555]|uniref:ABC transporter ATP-binding protein n=2 Tax=Neokomagataea TaxID=1223423 RepID=A0A4Y6V7H5_9PROT|nr:MULTISPECIES: ABC transporter ATP-binding protein [Neokomagataea]QDH24275.1 ABC transporter ATP-binding protein [Neokomagataea tanensis]GBR53008.1 ABC transporter ATP-binding protein [Neokomagataea thailandica NBRC 106555]